MQVPFESGVEAVSQLKSGVNGSFCPQDRRRYVLISAILASALGFIDGSILAIAIPAIRSDLGASLVEAQWISNAYALTLSSLILAGGAAGDRFGLRRVFVIGIAVFVFTSMACALAPNSMMLILFRALQGIGAAIMIPGSLAIIAKAFPRNERGRAIGIWAAASALTTAIGPVIGGLMLSTFGDEIWRAIFAINLPLGGTAIYLLLKKVPADKPTIKRSLDLGGAILATGALAAIAYGLSFIRSAGSLAMFGNSLSAVAIGVALLAIFVWWEWRHREPMIELALFSIRPFSGANAVTFLLYFALSSILFYLPMLLIAGWGLSTAEVGFVFVPLSVAIAVLSGPVGNLSDRIGPRFPITAGSLLVALAFGGLAIMTGSQIHSFWAGAFVSMVVMGVGMALVVSPLSTAVMMAVEDEDTGAASGINNAISRIAGLMAVAAMGSVAAWAYSRGLGSIDPSDIPGFGEPVASALPAHLELARRNASDAAFSAVAWVTAVLCVLSAFTAWFNVPGYALPWLMKTEKR